MGPPHVFTLLHNMCTTVVQKSFLNDISAFFLIIKQMDCCAQVVQISLHIVRPFFTAYRCIVAIRHGLLSLQHRSFYIRGMELTFKYKPFFFFLFF
jgi:hypothetical protein